MSESGGFTTPKGKEIKYDVLDKVELVCENDVQYKYVIKKIQYRDDNEIAYIFGYYFWHPKGYWHWMRKPLIVTSDEIQELLKKAEAKGFFKE